MVSHVIEVLFVKSMWNYGAFLIKGTWDCDAFLIKDT